VTARLRQQVINERPQTEAVSKLSQQGQAPMGGQGFVGPIELEGQHRLLYHGLTLWVKGNVVAHPLYIRSQSGPQGFSFIPIAVLG